MDVFITDIAQFAAFNKVYEEYFSAHKPARAVVEVKGLPRGVMVEVKCVAVAPRWFESLALSSAETHN